MRSVLVLLLAASCARASSGSQQDGSPYDPTDVGGGNDAGNGSSDAGNGGNSDAGNGGNSDAGNGGGGDGGVTLDASVTVDAAMSGAQLAQYSSRSCWSWGGFGSVRPDAPAHVIGFLEDADGVADIAMQAEVIILGAGTQYSLGMRTLEAFGDSGCCQRAMKVPIDYTDFVAAAQVISAGAAMWGVRVIYHDLGGHTTTAVCDGAAGWRLNSTPIGS
jgi:hypothetical protein